ncbi:hypothetical protein HZB94_03060 [Candidatus Falkowbacteria bacterium]|nr:hypothetical protein [Candidatus Falkowbacteria bacterium]
MSAEMVMDSVGNGGNGGVEIGTDSSEATVAEVAVEAVVEKVPEKAVELVPKRRIVGFIQFDVAFGGKVPTDEVLAKFEIVEDGKKARRIEDITKAVVFKLGKDEMDTCFLLCSEVTGEEFQKILEAGGQKAFRCGVKRALEIRAAVKDEVDFQQCRHDAIKGLVTHDFGDRNSVWVAMRTMVEWPIKNFGPVVGELEDRERRLEMCAENAIEFEKAYASALKSDAPRDRKTFERD